MASSCTQLCRSCRSLLGSKTRQFYGQVHRSVSSSWTSSKSGTREFIMKITTTGQSQLKWSSQVFYYSDSAVSNSHNIATNEKVTEECSGSEAALYKPSLLPNKGTLPQIDNHFSPDLDAATELLALEDISDEEAVSISVPTSIPPSSFSLKDYVDKSETLTKLVQLGVNLWKLEQRPNVGSMLLKLDFNTDITPRLLFLKEIGVEDSRFGYIITHNPFILTESVENLETRVNYLKSKRFSLETVASMVSRAPYLLNFSVKRLDNRLGFYQQSLSLSAANTRNIVARLPRLLCGSLEPVKENLKVCEIELGFKTNEIQHIVIAVPKVLTANKKKLIKIFQFLHNTMKVPHYLITKFPQVLNTKYLRLQERHLFLEYLGKAQYDPALDNYISLDRLVSVPDEVFCTELALATLEDFYSFQKTI